MPLQSSHTTNSTIRRQHLAGSCDRTRKSSEASCKAINPLTSKSTNEGRPPLISRLKSGIAYKQDLVAGKKVKVRRQCRGTRTHAGHSPYRTSSTRWGRGYTPAQEGCPPRGSSEKRLARRPAASYCTRALESARRIGGGHLRETSMELCGFCTSDDNFAAIVQ